MSDAFTPVAGLLPVVLAQVNLDGQASANRGEVLTVLLAAAALFAIGNLAFTFWRNITGSLRISPPPGETYQTRVRCDKLHDDLTAMLAGIDGRQSLNAQAVQAGIEHKLDVMDERHTQRTNDLEETLTNAITAQSVKSSAEVTGVHRRVDKILMLMGKGADE